MKEIRQIKEVVSTNFNDENNNEDKSSLLTNFDSEGGYYQQVIKPMLAAGHETELVYWLKNFGLLKSSQMCKNKSCEMVMQWVPARVQDLYQWKCMGCQQKTGIRCDSPFSDIKCNLKNAIRILLGWCKQNDISWMAEILDVKKNVVGNLYNLASTVAEKYLKSHKEEWQIGGPNIIVIIDVYPDNINNGNQLRNSKPILCLSEVKSSPPKYWFELLDRCSRNNPEQVKLIKEKIISSIREIVLPGSILVTQLNSPFCSYYDVQELKDIYPTIVSVDGLARHNNEEQNVYANLEVIWKNGFDLCELALEQNPSFVQQYLMSYLWQQRFQTESFEMLLYQLSVLQ